MNPRPAPPRGRPTPRSTRPPSPTRVRAFATDLDRTILSVDGDPTEAGRTAIRTARRLGLVPLLVSGRRLDALRRYAKAFGGFGGIVAENGGVVEVPIGTTPVVLGRRTAGSVRRLLPAPLASEAEFGEVVASFPYRRAHRLARILTGLPVQLLRNVDRVMVLPRGVTKGSGVRSALRRLRISRWGYAAIGDGENDVDMLRGAALSGAVANATPSVRRVADYRCRGEFAEGVLEFVEGPLTARMGADR